MRPPDAATKSVRSYGEGPQRSHGGFARRSKLQVKEGPMMNTRGKGAARRLVVALLLAGGLGGCVYDPYYYGYGYPAYGYSGYGYPAYAYPTYRYPTYVGPPVSLSFGYYEYRHHGRYHGKHYGQGWRGHPGHGWRGHGQGGWGQHRGGRH